MESIELCPTANVPPFAWQIEVPDGWWVVPVDPAKRAAGVAAWIDAAPDPDPANVREALPKVAESCAHTLGEGDFAFTAVLMRECEYGLPASRGFHVRWEQGPVAPMTSAMLRRQHSTDGAATTVVDVGGQRAAVVVEGLTSNDERISIQVFLPVMGSGWSVQVVMMAPVADFDAMRELLLRVASSLVVGEPTSAAAEQETVELDEISVTQHWYSPDDSAALLTPTATSPPFTWVVDVHGLWWVVPGDSDERWAQAERELRAMPDEFARWCGGRLVTMADTFAELEMGALSAISVWGTEDVPPTGLHMHLQWLHLEAGAVPAPMLLAGFAAHADELDVVEFGGSEVAVTSKTTDDRTRINIARCVGPDGWVALLTGDCDMTVDRVLRKILLATMASVTVVEPMSPHHPVNLATTAFSFSVE